MFFGIPFICIIIYGIPSPAIVSNIFSSAFPADISLIMSTSKFSTTCFATTDLYVSTEIRISGYSFQNVKPKKPLFAVWLYEGKWKNEIDFELGWYENMDVSIVSYGDKLDDGSPNKLSNIRIKPSEFLNDEKWHNVTMIWRDSKIQVFVDDMFLGETIAPERNMHLNIGVYSHNSDLCWSTFIDYIRISKII